MLLTLLNTSLLYFDFFHLHDFTKLTPKFVVCVVMVFDISKKVIIDLLMFGKSSHSSVRVWTYFSTFMYKKFGIKN